MRGLRNVTQRQYSGKNSRFYIFRSTHIIIIIINHIHSAYAINLQANHRKPKIHLSCAIAINC